ncbi:hypothetical protein JI435_143550, partial [Parastagonospora nodorum SN15]
QRPKRAKMTADCALVTTAGLSASIRLRSDAGVAQVWASKSIFVVVRPGSPLLAATARNLHGGWELQYTS